MIFCEIASFHSISSSRTANEEYENGRSSRRTEQCPHWFYYQTSNQIDHRQDRQSRSDIKREFVRYCRAMGMEELVEMRVGPLALRVQSVYSDRPVKWQSKPGGHAPGGRYTTSGYFKGLRLKTPEDWLCWRRHNHRSSRMKSADTAMPWASKRWSRLELDHWPFLCKVCTLIGL